MDIASVYRCSKNFFTPPICSRLKISATSSMDNFFVALNPMPVCSKRGFIDKVHEKRLFGRSIEERPEEVTDRIVCGHWEIDTVVGHRSGKESVVLTLVEKATDFYMAIKIPAKNAQSVMMAMEVLHEEYSERFANIFKTITADNGTEFERLSELEEHGTKVYFAHPYSSWERGQNERHNRLFRRYIPKGTSFDIYSTDQILNYADEMNALPRRQLGYCTPEEHFEQFLDEVYSVVRVQTA